MHTDATRSRAARIQLDTPRSSDITSSRGKGGLGGILTVRVKNSPSISRSAGYIVHLLKPNANHAVFRQTRSHTNRELVGGPGSPFKTPEGLLGERGA